MEIYQHSAALDTSLKRKFNAFQKQVAAALTSRKKLDAAVVDLFPVVFELRLKALKWIGENKEKITDLLDDATPEVDRIIEDKQLKKLAGYINSAFHYNRKLIVFLEDTGFDESKLNDLNTDDIDYNTLMMALPIMNPAQSRSVFGLLSSSLSVEFLCIAASLLRDGKASASPFRLKQLEAFAKVAVNNYMIWTRWLIDSGYKELKRKENAAWSQVGMQGLASAYGEDEPEYDSSLIKEPNPDYIP